jgi:hypothetical protein
VADGEEHRRLGAGSNLGGREPPGAVAAEAAMIRGACAVLRWCGGLTII